MNNLSNMEGGCLCGALRYSIFGKAFDSEYCHCRICQKSAGAVVVTWMDFKIEQLTWIKDKPTEYSSSENARRGFCQLCGSSLSFRDERHPDYVSLSTASLDDPNLVRPTYHIFTESQPEWLNIVDDCERYPQARAKTSAL
jgi:hypothetical protein